MHSLGITDRLVAQLWWHHHQNNVPVEFVELLKEDHEAGYPAVNRTREKEKLRKDKRTTSGDKGKTFKLQLRAVSSLDEKYLGLLKNRQLPKSDTVFALDDFKSTRGYIQKVVQQINVSYDVGLWDCCAVMIRRLLETLIIELYISIQRAEELKKDGHFMMFSGLLSFLENDTKVNLGRQTITALKAFKNIADSSAHNPAYNASKKIIDDKLDDVKLAVVELKQRAFDGV